MYIELYRTDVLFTYFAPDYAQNRIKQFNYAYFCIKKFNFEIEPTRPRA